MLGEMADSQCSSLSHLSLKMLNKLVKQPSIFWMMALKVTL